MDEASYIAIKHSYELSLKQDREVLEAVAQTLSKVQLGWDNTVDKYSRIAFIMENTYGRKTYTEFMQQYEAEKLAIKKQRRKERREARKNRS